MKFDEALNKLNNEAKQALSKSASLEDMLKIFANNGIDITAADIKEAINKKGSELSDDELDNVSGGLNLVDIFQTLMNMGVGKIKEKLEEGNK